MNERVRPGRWWVALLLAGPVVMALAFAVPAWSAASARRPVPGDGPPAVAAGRDLGPVDGSQRLTVRVYLRGRDPDGLAAYARTVSDPTSPAYHQYLTPAQVRARFGPPAAQVRAVASWLAGAGLAVRQTTEHYVAAQGPVGAIDAAFGTRLDRYAQPDGGVARAPRAIPTVPATLGGAVLAVTGLTSTPPRPASDAPAAAGAAAAGSNCSPWFGAVPATGLPPAYGSQAPWAVCGYTGRQLRAAYGVTADQLTGAGATVAIVNQGALPTMPADADRVAAAHGDPRLDTGQYRQLLLCEQDDSCGKPGSYNAEEALDIEAVHAMAPGADIVYVGTSTTSADAPLDGLTAVVDGRLADVVSDSWYLKGTENTIDAATVAAYEQVFEQGAAEGIGFYFGTGDAGDQAFTQPQPGWDGRPHVNYPASDPWVTAVGGTSLAIDGNNRYRFETGWGDDEAAPSADGTTWASLPGAFTGGSGGGTSERFNQPWYQRGVVPTALATAHGPQPMRVLPDVAADADPFTGLATGYTDPASGIYTGHTTGGTSLACPLIAAIQADAQQADHGQPQGFANPALYLRAGAFHDVTDQPLGAGVPVIEATPTNKKQPGQPGLITLGHDTSLTATLGFDDVTGLGSPTATYLRWADHAARQQPSRVALTP